MEILEIIIPIAAICNFSLGLFVLFSDFSKKLNRFFGFFCFLTSIWIFTNFMMGIQPNLFWLKSASALGVLVLLSGLLWVLELCEKKISKLNLILLIILGLFFFVLSYINDLILSNIRKIYLGGFEGERGPFFIPFWCYIFGILLFIIYILISSYLKATRVRRLQLLYVIIGAILYISTVVSVSFILPLFEIRHFIPLDTPSSIFLIFFTTLAITRYHLFEIKVILTEILVGAMGIVLLVLPFLMPTANLKILTLSIFLLFLIFGYLLIKYTHQEIKRKEELEEAYRKIEALSEMKSEFLKVVNHQLRTPFSIIRGLVSMMSEGDVSPERQKRIHSKVKSLCR